jgi:prepilin-type N-terminal cleavage/methylation domain-containing protein
MRKSPTSAFTLLEMLVVLAIIVILAGLVLSVGSYVQKKSALARASGEIAALSNACESYKSDNGNYPRDVPATAGGASVTDDIWPKRDFDPTASGTAAKYAASSLFLYKELTGDKTGSTGGQPDGIPDDGQPRYLKEYDQRIVNATRNPTTKVITAVNYLQDPFGFPYAYSTAAASQEQAFQTNLLKNPGSKTTAARPTGVALHGFNPGSYDLWSTGGKTTRKGSDTDDVMWANWVKNW